MLQSPGTGSRERECTPEDGARAFLAESPLEDLGEALGSARTS